MPGVERLSIDLAVKAAEEAAALGLPAIALFPNTDPSLRDEQASEALNPGNLVCRAVRAIKQAVPEIGIICDVALDPYTSHGHDGLLIDGEIDNDGTRRGADQPGPGAGRGRLRHPRAVRHDGRQDRRDQGARSRRTASPTPSCSLMRRNMPRRSTDRFATRWARRATLKGDKRSYQMDPANGDEALREVALDIDEGADMVMVKPGLAYLDIVWRVKQAFKLPTFVYQTSGEYSMLMAASERGWLDRERVMLESLIAFKRAGADAIFTYFARDAAKLLRSS